MATTITSSTQAVDRFDPITTPAPDWSAAGNWSDGAAPAPGTVAVLDGVTASIDPGVTLGGTIDLGAGASGQAGIVGNGGAVVFGAAADLSIATGTDAALYASDSLVNGGTISLAPGAAASAVVDIGARTGLTGAPPPDFVNAGTILLGTGSSLGVEGTEFRNQGMVVVDGGTLDVTGGAVAGGGTISLANGATVRFADAVTNETFVFGTGGADLVFGDTVDLTGLTMIGATSTDTISGYAVSRPSAVRVSEPQAAFGSAPPCFAAGTMILTPSGDRPVESLREGDLVVTRSGVAQPIVWAGSYRAAIGAQHAAEQAQPIRIEASAFAPSRPRRPLYLSPDHGVYVAGALVPAKLLVNGATIRRETGCVAIAYHHLELARHELLIAEGIACESYLDTGNRTMLGGPTIRAKHWDRDACAPLVTTGPRLATARRILHDRALALGFRPAPRLELDLLINGSKARRLKGTSDLARFTLPRGARLAVLRSSRFVPAEFDPESEDRRRLGVALTAIETDRGTAPPETLIASGGHPRSAGDTSLWTDGTATLRLNHDTRHLTLRLAALPLGWTRPATPGAN